MTANSAVNIYLFRQCTGYWLVPVSLKLFTNQVKFPRNLHT